LSLLGSTGRRSGSAEGRRNGRRHAALASLEVRAGRGRREGEGDRQPASTLSAQACAWPRVMRSPERADGAP